MPKFDQVYRGISRFLYVCLGLMALCIIYNLLTEYIIPEIKKGEISFRPKGWQYDQRIREENVRSTNRP